MIRIILIQYDAPNSSRIRSCKTRRTLLINTSTYYNFILSLYVLSKPLEVAQSRRIPLYAVAKPKGLSHHHLHLIFLYTSSQLRRIPPPRTDSNAVPSMQFTRIHHLLSQSSLTIPTHPRSHRPSLIPLCCIFISLPFTLIIFITK